MIKISLSKNELAIVMDELQGSINNIKREMENEDLAPVIYDMISDGIENRTKILAYLKKKLKDAAKNG